MGHRAESPTAVLMLKIIVPIAAFAMASLPTLAVSQPSLPLNPTPDCVSQLADQAPCCLWTDRFFCLGDDLDDNRCKPWQECKEPLDLAPNNVVLVAVSQEDQEREAGRAYEASRQECEEVSQEAQRAEDAARAIRDGAIEIEEELIEEK